MEIKEQTFTRESVLEVLRDNPEVHISFFKVDGSLRDMNCTLNEEVLNTLLGSTTFKVAQTVDYSNTISVFDLDKRDWRSFVLDNLVSMVVLG